jgi:hypothetical protein
MGEGNGIGGSSGWEGWERWLRMGTEG